jgi:hypothetical protein
MSLFRRPKSVITDYRPPIAGWKPPLERNARPVAVACPTRPADRTMHDAAVAELSDAVLLSAARDLGGRRAINQRDPEARWVLGRLGALAREIDRRRLNRTEGQS